MHDRLERCVFLFKIPRSQDPTISDLIVNEYGTPSLPQIIKGSANISSLDLGSVSKENTGDLSTLKGKWH